MSWVHAGHREFQFVFAIVPRSRSSKYFMPIHQVRTGPGGPLCTVNKSRFVVSDNIAMD